MVNVEFADGTVKQVRNRQVRNIIKELGFKETTVLITKGEELLTGDLDVEDGDTVKIIQVVSGG